MRVYVVGRHRWRGLSIGVCRKGVVEFVHYCRMLLTRHYYQRPFDETVYDAIIANSGVKKPAKKVQNVCDDGCIKHGSDFSCVCDEWHTIQFN